MSRITCLMSFSGFSALSIRSFRFARIKVATRSINDISLLQFSNLLLDSPGSGEFRPPQSPYRDQDSHSNAYEQPSPQMAEEIANQDANHQPEDQSVLEAVFCFRFHRCSPFESLTLTGSRLPIIDPSNIPRATPRTIHPNE